MAITNDGVDTDTGQIVDWGKYNAAHQGEARDPSGAVSAAAAGPTSSGTGWNGGPTVVTTDAQGNPSPLYNKDGQFSYQPGTSGSGDGGDSGSAGNTSTAKEISVALETLKLQQAQQAASQAYQEGLLKYNNDHLAFEQAQEAALEAYRNAGLALDWRKQYFTEDQTLAQLRSNPRNYLEAAFLGASRGGLGGLAPNNQIDGAPGSIYGAPAGGTPYGSPVSGVPLGQPGALDHYATVAHPDGTQIQYYGTPVQDATTGEIANIPVGAFGRALLSGQRVPQSGTIGTTGGWTFGSALRNSASLDPSKWAPADYLAGTLSEQDQAKALASYGGYSDADTAAKIKANIPDAGSVSHGLSFV